MKAPRTELNVEVGHASAGCHLPELMAPLKRPTLDCREGTLAW